MITAKEARRICDNSKNNVDSFITDKIEPQIREQSEKGLNDMTFDISESHGDLINTLVTNRLNELGFSAYIERRHNIWNDGIKPSLKTYIIIITW